MIVIQKINVVIQCGVARAQQVPALVANSISSANVNQRDKTYHFQGSSRLNEHPKITQRQHAVNSLEILALPSRRLNVRRKREDRGNEPFVWL
jgi:hypothetical protein